MGTLEHVYWLFAVPSTIIFLIYMIITFAAGADVDGDFGDADADVDGDAGIGFQFFSLKNLVGFFTIFSWAGLACIDANLGTVSYNSYFYGMRAYYDAYNGLHLLWNEQASR